MVSFILGVAFGVLLLFMLAVIDHNRRERIVREAMAEKYNGYINFADGEHRDIRNVTLAELVEMTKQKQVRDMDVNGADDKGGTDSK